MLVEPFSCNREEDAFSIRKPVWKSMTVFLVRFVRNRQHLWVSAVAGDPKKSRIPAGCHNNRIIRSPVSPKTHRLIANHRRHTALNGDLHELAVDPESDPPVIR